MTDKHILRTNSMISPAGVDANVVYFIVINLGVNGHLMQFCVNSPLLIV